MSCLISFPLSLLLDIRVSAMCQLNRIKEYLIHHKLVAWPLELINQLFHVSGSLLSDAAQSILPTQLLYPGKVKGFNGDF